MTTSDNDELTAGSAEGETDLNVDVEQSTVDPSEETRPSPSRDDLQSELAARGERVSALEEQNIALERELTSTVSRYRLALLDAAPEIPGDLVNGATAEELEASMAKARNIVEHVRSQLLESMGKEEWQGGDAPTADNGVGAHEQDASIARIPAGAPQRSDRSAAVSTLTTRDKITLGLERL